MNLGSNCSPARPRADHKVGTVPEPHGFVAGPKTFAPHDQAVAPSPWWAQREWNSPFEAEQDARRMYQRVLAGWAMDVLSLRRRGLETPRAALLRAA